MAKGDGNQPVVEGAVVGLGAGLGAYLGSRRGGAAAAPPSEAERLDAIIALLQELKTTDAAILAALKALVLPGAPGEVSTPWKAKEPELLLAQAIRSVGTFISDKMVDFRNGKRLLFKVESSLDQNVTIQLVGNKADGFNQATDVDGPFPCLANGNISMGLAWDDWHPYVGVRITAAVAPTVGMLNIWSVLQE
jgi:hypothetical protein